MTYACDAVTHPSSPFIGGINKPPLKLFSWMSNQIMYKAIDIIIDS